MGEAATSEYQKLRTKYDDMFNKEVAELQAGCPHSEVSDWIEIHWAPGHGTGTFVKECKRCCKHMHEKTNCRQTKTRGKTMTWCGKEIVDNEIIRLHELVESGKYTYDDFRYPQKAPDGETYMTIALQSPVCKECFDTYLDTVKKARAMLNHAPTS